MSQPKVNVLNRESNVRIEIDTQDNETLFTIIATEKGIEITGNYLYGDMVIKPQTGNVIAVTFVDNASIFKKQ